MRRLLFLLLFLPSAVFATTPAWVQSDGSFSLTTAASTQTDTLTHTSTSGNSIIVHLAWKTTTRTLTSVTATNCVFMPFTGQIGVANGSNVKTAIAIGLNCPAISSITVTWSGTTVADTQVEEWSGIAAIGQIAQATGTSTAPAVTITTQDANNAIVMSSANLATGGNIPTSNTGNLRDASESGATSSFESGAACDNTTASAGTALKCQVTISSVAWSAVAIELRSTTSPMTDHVSSAAANTPSSSEAAAANNIKFNLPFPSLAGNTVVCWASFAYSVTRTLSIVDDKSDTLVSAKKLDDSSNGMSLWVYYAATTTGALTFTFTWDAAMTNNPITLGCSQFYNIATSSPVDVTCGTAGVTPPALTCGSMTTTVPDVIFNIAAYDNSGGPNPSNVGMGYCAGGQNFTLLIPQSSTGNCSQMYVDAGTGAINPSMYFPYGVGGITSGVFNDVGVAFKISGGQGTAPPSGFNIVRQWVEVENGANTNYMNCPSTSTFTSAAFSDPVGGGGFTITDNGASGTNQAVWSNNAPNGSAPSLYYHLNSPLDSSAMCKVVHTSSNTDEIMLRDISGVATSNAFDTGLTCSSPSTYAAAGCYNNSMSVSGGSITNGPNITPATGELLLVSLQLGTGPPTAITSPTTSGTVISDCPFFTGMTDADYMCAGEGHAHLITTNTNAETWTWTVAAGSGSATAWALKPVPAGTTVSNQFPRVQ